MPSGSVSISVLTFSHFSIDARLSRGVRVRRQGLCAHAEAVDFYQLVVVGTSSPHSHSCPSGMGSGTVTDDSECRTT